MLERIADNLLLLLQLAIACTAMVAWLLHGDVKTLSVAGFSLTAIVIMLLLDIRNAMRETQRGKTDEGKTDA